MRLSLEPKFVKIVSLRNFFHESCENLANILLLKASLDVSENVLKRMFPSTVLPRHDARAWCKSLSSKLVRKVVLSDFPDIFLCMIPSLQLFCTIEYPPCKFK